MLEIALCLGLAASASDRPRSGEEAPPTHAGQLWVTGVISDKSLYCLRKTTSSNGRSFNLHLSRCGLEKAKGEPLSLQSHRMPTRCNHAVEPFSWRMHEGSYWAVRLDHPYGDRVPKDDLPM